MGKIQNAADLATTPARKAALAIAKAGLQAIDTQKVVTEAIAKLDLSLENNGRLFVVAIGKCATEGMLALEKVLGDNITDAIVFDIAEGQFTRARFLLGDHPFSTTRNKNATKHILNFLKITTEADTVLFLISGGGSALLCQPQGHTCESEAELIKQLFAKGVAIQELNVVRKHLSLARGGYLAQAAHPAKVISLIFSDVPGNGLDVVSSGPTAFDETTKEDAQRILEKYGLKSYAEYLVETPKDKEYFENVRNILVVSNKTALDAMRKKAQELGFAANVQDDKLQGEARDVAKDIVDALRKAPAKSVLLYGGETTVTVKKPGKGGRNLELALSALLSIDYNELVLPVASDGLDNTEYAGAIADLLSKEHALAKNLDAKEYLDANQSFPFFEQTGDYLLTGNTGSNVSDLIIAIKE